MLNCFCNRSWRSVDGTCLNLVLAFRWWQSHRPIWTRFSCSRIGQKRPMKLSLMTRTSGKWSTRPPVYASTAALGLEFPATAGSPLLWKIPNSNKHWIALQRLRAFSVTELHYLCQFHKPKVDFLSLYANTEISKNWSCWMVMNSWVHYFVLGLIYSQITLICVNFILSRHIILI